MLTEGLACLETEGHQASRWSELLQERSSGEIDQLGRTWNIKDRYLCLRLKRVAGLVRGENWNDKRLEADSRREDFCRQQSEQ